MTNEDGNWASPDSWHERAGALDPRDLTLPLYGATFGQALTRFFRGYLRFSGRVSRSEYWWPALALVIVCIVGVGAVAGLSAIDSLATIIRLGVIAVVVVWILPSWAVLVRRLHDADLSGWLCLIALIPYLGGIFTIVVGLLPARPLGSRFDRQ